MTDLIEKLFVKNPEDRDCYGKVAGIVGIICNLLLATAKMAIGLLFSVLSITADGLNNLADATSSIVTLVSFRIAGMPADKEHPYGHQRMEYFSGVIVSVLILLVGFELGKESVEKILHPTQPQYGWVMVGVLVLSILVKLWMYLFNRGFSKKIGSSALKATAQDCINDVFTTAAVLLSVVLSWAFHINLDGIMGLLVAAFILFSGIKMIRETANPLLGVAADPETVGRIKQKILGFDGVLGVHDLMIHDYGPARRFASVHVEMDSQRDIMLSHDITDRIERSFLEDGIHLVVHMDPVVVGDPKVDALRLIAAAAVKRVDSRMSIHDFRAVVGVLHSNLIFDIAVPFDVSLTDTEVIEAVTREIKQIDENYYPVIDIDRGVA